jgi:hypothetical protein
MMSNPLKQVLTMASVILSSKSEKQSEIDFLTTHVDHLTAAFDFWNRWMRWGLGVAALAAVWIGLTTRLTIVRSKQLAVAQGQLDAAKEAQLKLSLQESDQKIANANKAAGDANEKAALAQLELARLTGPPYLVPVIHGTATPDLSKGTKQLVLLTSDTRINLPKLPEGKSLTWTLILAQDEVGQRQFTFSPQISGLGNTLFSPGHSKWLVNLLTDSNGTVNVGLGGTFAPAPKVP